MIEFTYVFYKKLIELIKNQGYIISDYFGWKNFSRTVIMRHDIDASIEKAVAFSEIEKKLGVSSTYFVLITSDLYNVFSAKNIECLKKIMVNGHSIGLHFDEKVYPEALGRKEAIIEKILYEKQILELALDTKINVVSMHRPSSVILNTNLEIPGMVNSYSSTFFENMKYLSDSRRNWREPVIDLISEKRYDRLHILTHPLWYTEENQSLHDRICSYVNGANKERYQNLKLHISDFDSIMSTEEIHI